MIIKCRQCDEPMTESRKGRPENLPENCHWYMCRECDKGVEVIGDNNNAPEDVGEVNAIEYTQTVTMTQYVTIKKNKKGVRKFTYADKERTKLISEEEIN